MMIYTYQVKTYFVGKERGFSQHLPLLGEYDFSIKYPITLKQSLTLYRKQRERFN